MSVRESLRLSAQGLMANRLRSGLTMLGILIGVGAVILLVAVGNGTAVQVQKQVAALGSNILYIYPASTRGAGGVSQGFGSGSTLTQADITALNDQSQAPHIVTAIPITQAAGNMTSQNQNGSAPPPTSPPPYAQVPPYPPASPSQDLSPPPGDKFTRDQTLTVPDHPVSPFIRGDGTGPDIWAASVRVMDAAVEKAYGGKKKISWFEVFAGQAAKDKFDNWLPDDTVTAFREYLVGIKGPLTTPVGGGISSLNVALRQMLDLFVCLRPV